MIWKCFRWSSGKGYLGEGVSFTNTVVKTVSLPKDNEAVLSSHGECQAFCRIATCYCELDISLINSVCTVVG